MKSEGQTRQKLKQVLFRYRKRKIRDSLKKYPCNCIHNGSLNLPDSFLSERSEVNLCTYPGNLTTCDNRVDGDLEKAQHCDFFTPRVTAQEVKDEFRDDLEGKSVAMVAEIFPDAAALLWVLGKDHYSELGMDWEEEEEDVE